MNSSKFQLANNENGGLLTYTLSPDESVIMFEHGMLLNNSLKGYLGYVYEKRGGNTMLTYNIRRGTRLSLLKNTSMKKQAVLKILTGLTDMAMLAEEYMLEERHLSFDDEHIFVDVSTYDVYAPYIPTNQFAGTGLASFIKNYIINSVLDTNSDGYLLKLLNFVNSRPNASAAEFKQTLRKLEQEGPQQAQLIQNIPQPQINQPAPLPPRAAPQQPVQPMGSMQQIPPGAGFAPQDHNPAPAVQTPPVSAPTPRNDAKKSSWPWKKKEKPAAVPSGFSGMNFPGQQVNPAAQQNMQILPAPQAVQSFPAPPSQPAKPGKAPKPAKPPKFARSAENQHQMAAAPVLPPVNEPQNGLAPMSANVPAPEIIEEPEANYTVLINSASPRGGSRPCLISAAGDRIAVTKSGFTIGKDPSASIPNDYIIRKNPSVSRNHAMITCQNGQYFVTDMTSLNGTFVNGTRINSNYPCAIRNGDSITFANEKYTFRIE